MDYWNQENEGSVLIVVEMPLMEIFFIRPTLVRSCEHVLFKDHLLTLQVRYRDINCRFGISEMRRFFLIPNISHLMVIW